MSNHPYTFNLKKEEEVPDETQDPAYKAGLRMGESVLEFFRIAPTPIPYLDRMEHHHAIHLWVTIYQLGAFSWSLYSE